MRVEIKAKQPNSKMCFVSGVSNAFGLKSRFFELENQQLLALLTRHRSIKGILVDSMEGWRQPFWMKPSVEL